MRTIIAFVAIFAVALPACAANCSWGDASFDEGCSASSATAAAQMASAAKQAQAKSASGKKMAVTPSRQADEVEIGLTRMSAHHGLHARF